MKIHHRFIFGAPADKKWTYFWAIMICAIAYELGDFGYKMYQASAREKYDGKQIISEFRQTDEVYSYRIGVSMYTKDSTIAYLIIGKGQKNYPKNPIENLSINDQICYRFMFKGRYRQRPKYVFYNGIKPTCGEDFIPNEKYNCYEIDMDGGNGKYATVLNKTKHSISNEMIEQFFKKSGRKCYDLNTFCSFIKEDPQNTLKSGGNKKI